jgi:DNA-binding ferritin-like protein
MDMSILEAQADVLFGNVAGWEQSVLNRIAKRIDTVGKMSVADVEALNNIAFVKQDMKEITKDLAQMTKMNVSQIEKIYGDTIAQQHLENSPLYDYRNKKFVPFADNKELQAIVRAYSKTTAGNMVNLSKIGASNLGMLDENGKFKPIERFYTDALDKAVMQVASGSTDFHTTMRDVVQTMGGSGIRVSYPGTDITRRLDTAVRQALLWGAKQASVEYNEMIGEELGCDGIEVDWHSFPRPSHEFMQGKQFVLGKAQKINGVMFESADDALRALNDYGCLHYKTPIICGISEPRYSKLELAELNKRNAQTFDIDGKQMTGYEAKQAMRRLETAVREQKTTREAARNAGDKVLADNCTAKIKAYQGKYNEICDITGMPPQPKRMSIPKGLNAITPNNK